MASAADEARRKFFSAGGGPSGPAAGGRSARRPGPVASAPAAGGSLAAQNRARFDQLLAKKQAFQQGMQNDRQAHEVGQTKLQHQNTMAQNQAQNKFTTQRDQALHQNTMAINERQNEFNAAADARRLGSEALLRGADPQGVTRAFATTPGFQPDLGGLGLPKEAPKADYTLGSIIEDGKKEVSVMYDKNAGPNSLTRLTGNTSQAGPGATGAPTADQSASAVEANAFLQSILREQGPDAAFSYLQTLPPEIKALLNQMNQQ